MTEKDKMLAGKMYDPSDLQLARERHSARFMCQQINNLTEDKKEERDKKLYDLLGKVGKNLWIEPPFFCDYGYNISIGDHVFFNFNCCILDVMPVIIGNNVMFGPNVQIYTASHPLEAKLRNSGREFAKPITIGNDVWIGGGAILNPGIVIGDRAVIGSGAVVTRDVPDDVFVGGNPARIIKKI